MHSYREEARAEGPQALIKWPPYNNFLLKWVGGDFVKSPEKIAKINEGIIRLEVGKNSLITKFYCIKSEQFITEKGDREIVNRATTVDENPSIEGVKNYITKEVVGPAQKELTKTQEEAAKIKAAIAGYTRLSRVKNGFLAFAGIAAIATGIAFGKKLLRPTQLKLATALTPISLVGAGVANFGANSRAKKAAKALNV